jgi:alcohol dehydrogenase
MLALVYKAPGRIILEDRLKPTIKMPTDVIIKITKTTISGTDLHILKGNVATCLPGTVMGHEGVGVVNTAGAAVINFKPGTKVLISSITACGRCEFCRIGMGSHCTTGGWILGNSINGTQAEFVRIPHADTSLYPIPKHVEDEALIMLSDVLPAGFDCGVLNGKIQIGARIAIVGSGPAGLAALLAAQFFYSPSKVIMIDPDGGRLALGTRLGATETVNSVDGIAARQVMTLTGGHGVDTAIDAVGISATYRLCENIVAPGGAIVNVNVPASRVDPLLERLWSHAVSSTAPQAETVSNPMRIKTEQDDRIGAKQLTAHRFRLDQILQAYEAFGSAADTMAMKVIIET